MGVFHLFNKDGPELCKSPRTCLVYVGEHFFGTKLEAELEAEWATDFQYSEQKQQHMQKYGAYAHPHSHETKISIRLSYEIQARMLKAASNANTEPDFLELISKSSNDTVRATVARNRHTPAEALQSLAKDKDARVRFQVALNMSADSNLLEALSDDTESSVRRNVAAHRNTYMETLRKLAKDPNRRVRGEVACNLRIDLELLEELANDESEYVRAHLLLALERRNDIHLWDKALIEGLALSLECTEDEDEDIPH